MFYVKNHELHYSESSRDAVPKATSDRQRKKQRNLLEGCIVYPSEGHGDFDSIIRAVPTNKTSWHLIVGIHGELTQFMPFDKCAYHVPKKAVLKAKSKRISDLNRRTIGIVMDNPGALTQVDPSTYRDCHGKLVSRSLVDIDAHGKAWKAYPRPQVDRLREVLTALDHHYRFKFIVDFKGIEPESRGNLNIPTFDFDTVIQIVRTQTLINM